MAAEFEGRVRVAIEDYGSSPIAERFGVRRYPVVFVDDVLLARPKDFGFGAPEDVSGGLYVPWRDPASQKRFKEDLRRATARRLAGERVAGLDVTGLLTPGDPMDGPGQMPPLALTSVDGTAVEFGSGRVVVIELWATWCPPCRRSLDELKRLQRKYVNEVTVVAIAVDSPPADVAKMAADLDAGYPLVQGTADIVNAFGNLAAVPKVLVFDRDGRLSSVIHGAPPDAAKRLEAAVAAAVNGKRGQS